jgi:hypothetical protein
MTNEVANEKLNSSTGQRPDDLDTVEAAVETSRKASLRALQDSGARVQSIDNAAGRPMLKAAIASTNAASAVRQRQLRQ